MPLPGAGSLPTGVPPELKYEDLRDKYTNFANPLAKIILGDQEFSSKGQDMVVGDIHVELSSGYEASVATFRLYDVFNADGTFRYEAVKKQVLMGNSVKIMLGYLGTMELVFVGFISGVSFGFEGGDLPYIEVTAMDVKGLMMGGSYCAQINKTSYSEAVKEVLRRTGEGVLTQMGGVTAIEVSSTPDAGGPAAKVSAPPGSPAVPAVPPVPQAGPPKSSPYSIEMVAESDYEFVVRAAKRFNFEFFVDRGTVLFRPAKSDSSILIDLGVRKGISQFHIEYSITGVVGEIEARAMDAGKGEVISASSKFNNTISTANKAKSLVGKGAKVYVDPSINSKEDAEARVASLMERMSYRLGSLEARCIGMPDLVPGRFISVSGMGSPVDNQFYVTKVTHDMSGDAGYMTAIEGCAAKISGGGAVKPPVPPKPAAAGGGLAAKAAAAAGKAAATANAVASIAGAATGIVAMGAILGLAGAATGISAAVEGGAPEQMVNAAGEAAGAVLGEETATIASGMADAVTGGDPTDVAGTAVGAAADELGADTPAGTAVGAVGDAMTGETTVGQLGQAAGEAALNDLLP